MQDIAFNLTVVLMLVFAAVFFFVILRSGERHAQTSIMQMAYKIRTFWFSAIIIVGIIITAITLPEAFKPNAIASDNTQTVKIVGHQWYWEIEKNEFETGKPIEFQVTSADVNHGFAIYDENKRLISQTQAMPDYVNHLTVTFPEAGTYSILCLEYCGLLHHAMAIDIIVTDGES